MRQTAVPDRVHRGGEPLGAIVVGVPEVVHGADDGDLAGIEPPAGGRREGLAQRLGVLGGPVEPRSRVAGSVVRITAREVRRITQAVQRSIWRQIALGGAFGGRTPHARTIGTIGSPRVILGGP